MSGARRKFVSVQMVVVPRDTADGATRVSGFSYLAIADDGTAWEAWQPVDGCGFESWIELPALPESQEPQP